MTKSSLPFELEKQSNFYEQLSQWVGDQFYDVFPEHGLEIRDEQVYMAYQLEKAFAKKEIILAEAGVGTGKTLVYLLYSICYARYMQKPAIIACADETLIEQLVKREGDIKKITDILQLNIDVRLAKSEDQYLCVKKLFDVISDSDDEDYDGVYDTLPPFVFNQDGFVNYSPYGDRKDYPNLSDKQWEQINWDVFQDCFTCEYRHRCGQTLSRDYYRKAKDLIVCSHDFYMKHIWTEEARKREGQLPYLPANSSVVFDEGHLLEFAAQKALTYTLKEEKISQILTKLLSNDIREELAVLIEDALKENEQLFDAIHDILSENTSDTERQYVKRDESWLSHIRTLQGIAEEIGDALVFESELYTIPEYELNIVNEYLDEMEYAFKLLQAENVIFWAEMSDEYTQIVIMPHLIQEVMKENVWSKKKPYIFSSATLSNNGDFDYIKKRLGIDQALSFTVASPYDYKERMKAIFKVSDVTRKTRHVLEYLEKTKGKSLILFANHSQLMSFKEESRNIQHDFEIMFEGDQEITNLVSYFQNNEHSVLCTEHLWEGLDIPGPSLSQVIVWDLPFPPNDPVFNSFRQASKDPFAEVDLPYMLLRLKQGVGRLIRTEEDEGNVVILFSEEALDKYADYVKEVLPVTPTIE